MRLLKSLHLDEGGSASVEATYSVFVVFVFVTLFSQIGAALLVKQGVAIDARNAAWRSAIFNDCSDGDCRDVQGTYADGDEQWFWRTVDAASQQPGIMSDIFQVAGPQYTTTTATHFKPVIYVPGQSRSLDYFLSLFPIFISETYALEMQSYWTHDEPPLRIGLDPYMWKQINSNKFFFGLGGHTYEMFPSVFPSRDE